MDWIIRLAGQVADGGDPTGANASGGSFLEGLLLALCLCWSESLPSISSIIELPSSKPKRMKNELVEEEYLRRRNRLAQVAYRGA